MLGPCSRQPRRVRLGCGLWTHRWAWLLALGDVAAAQSWDYLEKIVQPSLELDCQLVVLAVLAGPVHAAQVQNCLQVSS